MAMLNLIKLQVIAEALSIQTFLPVHQDPAQQKPSVSSQPLSQCSFEDIYNLDKEAPKKIGDKCCNAHQVLHL